MQHTQAPTHPSPLKVSAAFLCAPQSTSQPYVSTHQTQASILASPLDAATAMASSCLSVPPICLH